MHIKCQVDCFPNKNKLTFLIRICIKIKLALNQKNCNRIVLELIVNNLAEYKNEFTNKKDKRNSLHTRIYYDKILLQPIYESNLLFK